jgi:maltose/moltooligosaccharide transporter
MKKKAPNTRQMFNLTFAAFGIQFGSALQMANMSSIYKFLGANVNDLGFLWLAAPVTGLVIQPLFGFLSDRTGFWIGNRWFRRSPYMLAWAAVAFVSMFLMPNSVNLLMAALLLWGMDSSQNGATETFRAMLGDSVTRAEKTRTFAVQTFFATGGAAIAAALPWIMTTVFGMTGDSGGSQVPAAIHAAFYIGGTAFFVCVVYTILTTPEVPPENLEEFLEEKRKRREAPGGVLRSIGGGFATAFHEVMHLPRVIREFFPVQLFCWIGLFCMWIYFGMGIAQQIFGLPPGAKVSGNHLYSVELQKGTAWCGLAFSLYQIVAFLYSTRIARVADRIGGRATHGVSLILGGLALMVALFIYNQYILLLCMIGVGITWGSIMTIPYALIAQEVPESKLGFYMGLFNITITVPQIICALALGLIAREVFANNAMQIVFMGGAFLVIAGLLMLRLQRKFNQRTSEAEAAGASVTG